MGVAWLRRGLLDLDADVLDVFGEEVEGGVCGVEVGEGEDVFLWVFLGEGFVGGEQHAGRFCVFVWLVDCFPLGSHFGDGKVFQVQ